MLVIKLKKGISNGFVTMINPFTIIIALILYGLEKIGVLKIVIEG